MLYSKYVWEKNKHVYDSILELPFNQELMKGELSLDKFGYYIEQDSVYLHNFGSALAIIGARCNTPGHLDSFLDFSKAALIAEQELVHDYFRKEFQLKTLGLTTPALLNYTGFLLSSAALAPVEVAIAAILPCFWIYREVGLHIAKSSSRDNRYIKWIDTYCNEEFIAAVDKAISIFDEFASNASENTKAKMNEAYYNSSVLEWHFWNDAYNMTDFYEGLRNQTS